MVVPHLCDALVAAAVEDLASVFPAASEDTIAAAAAAAAAEPQRKKQRGGGGRRAADPTESATATAPYAESEVPLAAAQALRAMLAAGS